LSECVSFVLRGKLAIYCFSLIADMPATLFMSTEKYSAPLKMLRTAFPALKIYLFTNPANFIESWWLCAIIRWSKKFVNLRAMAERSYQNSCRMQLSTRE